MWNYMRAAPWLIYDGEFEDSERNNGPILQQEEKALQIHIHNFILGDLFNRICLKLTASLTARKKCFPS